MKLQKRMVRTVSVCSVKYKGGSLQLPLKTGTLETFIRIGLDGPLKKQEQPKKNKKKKHKKKNKPPPKKKTEIRYLARPIPFSIRTYTSDDLFAGKMHALLCRPNKIRVKGRDWYDFIWYVAKGIPLNLAHLETRMRQSGHYVSKTALNEESFLDLLREKMIKLSVTQAKEDIHRFIQNTRETDGRSAEFFLSLVPQIRFSK